MLVSPQRVECPGPSATGHRPDMSPPRLASSHPRRTSAQPARGCSPRAGVGPDRRSLRLALLVLVTGTFATGTDAFVICGVLPAVARSQRVSRSSAGLLVTGFATALGGPVL